MDGDAINITSDVSIYAIVFTNKKAYSFSVKDGILIHIAKSWEFEKNSKASFNFNVSVISLTNEPDFNKVSKVTGGAFLINGVHNKWDGDKWEAQNMFKSGHVPVATVTNPLCNGGLGSAVGSVIGGTDSNEDARQCRQDGGQEDSRGRDPHQCDHCCGDDQLYARGVDRQKHHHGIGCRILFGIQFL